MIFLSVKGEEQSFPHLTCF